MYKQNYGSIGQIQFTNEREYYRLLGYLAKSDGSTELVWEKNEEQGAWASEGRIKFLSSIPNNIGVLKLTAGVGNVLYRVNCNEFVTNLYENHNFVQGKVQNIELIRQTIPAEYMDYFNVTIALNRYHA